MPLRPMLLATAAILAAAAHVAAASPAAAQSAAGQAANTPASAASAERPPFALSLLVDNQAQIASPGWTAAGAYYLEFARLNGQALSALLYPDRPACELAGQQWALEVGLSAKFLAHATCVPQAADLPAMMARRRAAAQDAGSPR